MNIVKMMDQSCEEEFSICKIIHLPSLVALSQDLSRSLPDEFDEFLEDSHGSRNHHSTMVLLSQFNQDNNTTSEDDDDYDSETDLEKLQLLSTEYVLLEECQFLVQFRTNKRTYYEDKTSWTSSAGWYCTQWIAAPSIAKAWSMGLKWAKDMHKEDFIETTKGESE